MWIRRRIDGIRRRGARVWPGCKRQAEKTSIRRRSCVDSGCRASGARRSDCAAGAASAVCACRRGCDHGFGSYVSYVSCASCASCASCVECQFNARASAAHAPSVGRARLRALSEHDAQIVRRHLDDLVEREARRAAEFDHRFQIAHAPRRIAAAQLRIELRVRLSGVRAASAIRPVQVQHAAVGQRAPRRRRARTRLPTARCGSC